MDRVSKWKSQVKNYRQGVVAQSCNPAFRGRGRWISVNLVYIVSSRTVSYMVKSCLKTNLMKQDLNAGYLSGFRFHLCTYGKITDSFLISMEVVIIYIYFYFGQDRASLGSPG